MSNNCGGFIFNAVSYHHETSYSLSRIVILVAKEAAFNQLVFPEISL
jgi:hypothetical protein